MKSISQQFFKKKVKVPMRYILCIVCLLVSSHLFGEQREQILLPGKEGESRFFEMSIQQNSSEIDQRWAALRVRFSVENADGNAFLLHLHRVEGSGWRKRGDPTEEKVPEILFEQGELSPIFVPIAPIASYIIKPAPDSLDWNVEPHQGESKAISPSIYEHYSHVLALVFPDWSTVEVGLKWGPEVEAPATRGFSSSPHLGRWTVDHILQSEHNPVIISSRHASSQSPYMPEIPEFINKIVRISEELTIDGGRRALIHYRFEKVWTEFTVDSSEPSTVTREVIRLWEVSPFLWEVRQAP